MNYRIQDFIKYIIPGVYVIFFVVIWSVLSSNCHIETAKLKDLTGVIILLIPFVGFVIGYLIESLMTCAEHLFYILGGRRPSKNILDRKCKNYIISEIDRNKIFNQHNISGNSINNSLAGQILQTAKQKIDRENVENFRINSILARNIFGSQIVLTIAYSFVTDRFYTNKMWWFFLVISIIFLIYWIHHNHVYVKYVFAEYARNLH